MVNRTYASRGTDAHPSMPHPFDVSALFDASRPTLAATAELNGRVYETVAAFNTECVSFINRRLKEDLAMPQQFAACRSLEDVYGVYTGFFQRAAEQYQAEMEQLAKIGQGMAQDAMAHVPEHAGKPRRMPG